MDFIKRVPKILFYLFIITLLTEIVSCASSRKNTRSERPKKGKMKPCGCSNFGQYKTCYDAINHFS